MAATAEAAREMDEQTAELRSKTLQTVAARAEKAIEATMKSIKAIELTEETAVELAELIETMEFFSGMVTSLRADCQTYSFIGFLGIIGIIVAAAFIVSVIVKEVIRMKKGETERKCLCETVKTFRAVASLFKKLLTWLKQHENDYVELNGCLVKLDAVLEQFVDPLAKDFDEADKVAENLKELKNIPSKDQVHSLLFPLTECHGHFQELVDFVSGNDAQFPVLQTFPVTQADINNIDLLAATAEKTYNKL